MQEHFKKYLEIVYNGQFKVVEKSDMKVNDKNLLDSIHSLRNKDQYGQFQRILKGRFITGFSKHSIRDWGIDINTGDVSFHFNAHNMEKSPINEYCCFIAMGGSHIGNADIYFNVNNIVVQKPIFYNEEFSVILSPKGSESFIVGSKGKSILTRKVVFVFENATDTNFFLETYSAMKMVYERKKKKTWWF